MDKPLIVTLKCPNPDCGSEIRGPHPGKPGNYKTGCPKCGHSFLMNVSGPTANDVKVIDTNAGINVGKASVKAIEIDDDLFVNEQYNIKCPHCSSSIEVMSPQAGKAKKTCPNCNNVVIMEFKRHTYVAHFNDDGTPQIKLSYQIKGFLHTRKLEFPIGEGRYIVGRSDPSTPCEIAVESDPTMSRRSVEITGIRLPSGYSYKLKVLKATNPVMLNDEPLNIGAVVSIQPGDKFKLGKTIFKVEKLKL